MSGCSNQNKSFKRNNINTLVCGGIGPGMINQIDLTVSLLMPCRINVYTQNGKTVISTFRPTALAGIFNKPELDDFASEVEKTLIEIINKSK